MAPVQKNGFQRASVVVNDSHTQQQTVVVLGGYRNSSSVRSEELVLYPHITTTLAVPVFSGVDPSQQLSTVTGILPTLDVASVVVNDPHTKQQTVVVFGGYKNSSTVRSEELYIPISSQYVDTLSLFSGADDSQQPICVPDFWNNDRDAKT